MIPVRRDNYRPSLKNDDYLIVTHIGAFIQTELPRYLIPGAQVLDIGCGEQPLRQEVEGRGAFYTGADITQNRAQTVDHLCSITSIPLADEAIDLILCTEVMEHVAETEKAFHEMARILKKGGILLLTTPFLYPLHEEPHDFVRTTPYQIRRCAKAAGLEVLMLNKAGNELEVIASLFTRSAGWFFQAFSFRPARKIYAIWMTWTQALLNIFARWFTKKAGHLLPQQAYLNTQCVLRRLPAAQ